MEIPKKELKSFLDLKVEMYNRNSFIASDPIQVPHQFSKKEDIEIAGFLSATIAWGNRIMIIRNAKKMMEIMDNSPFDFIMNHSSKDLESITGFVHRTFNSNDLQYFIKSLQNIYQNHGGLESILKPSKGDINYQNSITEFKTIFLSKTFNSSATARPGKICPPVPPAIINNIGLIDFVILLSALRLVCIIN